MHDSVSELIKWDIKDLPSYLIDWMVDCFKVDQSHHFIVVTDRYSCTDTCLEILWHLVANLTYELIIQI